MSRIKHAAMFAGMVALSIVAIFALTMNPLAEKAEAGWGNL